MIKDWLSIYENWSFFIDGRLLLFIRRPVIIEDWPVDKENRSSDKLRRPMDDDLF